MRNFQSPKGLVKNLTSTEDDEEITLRQKPVPDQTPMRPLVIDLGTYTTKVGLAPGDFSSSELFPQMMVPTIVGQTKLLPGRLSDVNAAIGQTYYGFEALRRASMLSLKYPMEHGIVMDWDEVS